MITKSFKNDNVIVIARPDKRVLVVMPHPFNPGEDFCTKDPHDILNEPTEYTPKYTLNPQQKLWLKRVLLEIGAHEPLFKFASDCHDNHHRLIRRNDLVAALFRKDEIAEPRIVGAGNFEIEDVDLKSQVIDQINSLDVISTIQEFDEAQRDLKSIVDSLHRYRPKINW